MPARALLVVGASFSLFVAALAACSSFTASDTEPTADANTGTDATAISPADAGADAATDPCPDGPLGLYVIGGAVQTEDGGSTEAETMLRAPIRCDGSLGGWVVYRRMPRGMQYPAVGVLGDRLVIAGGFSDLPKALVSTIYTFDHGPDGGLSDYTPRDATGLTPRWRSAFAVAAGELVLLGGRDINNNVVSRVETLQLDGDTPIVKARAEMDQQRERFAAASVGDRIVVQGDPGGIAGAVVSGDGDVTGWKTLSSAPNFDGLALVDGTTVYFVGGYSDSKAVSIGTPTTAGDYSIVPGARLDEDIAAAAAVTSGGRFYIVSGSLGRRVVSGTFSTSGLVNLHDETTALPEARLGHVAVVF